ncbi:hypothetical protein [Massilia sp. X63]
MRKAAERVESFAVADAHESRIGLHVAMQIVNLQDGRALLRRYLDGPLT